MKTFIEFAKEMDDEIKVGDKVAYSRNFLKSTGMITGPTPFARGVVTDIKRYGSVVIASVDWGHTLPKTDDDGDKIAVGNLVKVDRMHLEPN